MECYLVANDCYKLGARLVKPKGVVVHSTGANNPYLKRYVQPIKSQQNYAELRNRLGINNYNNDWNRSGIDKCVHAFIGKTSTGSLALCKTLPINVKCWGCGKGTKGSYNDTHIQFEICEDALNDKKYFDAAFKMAAEYCASICREFGLSVDTIKSHYEAHKAGYASNHKDCDHWLKKFGKSMDSFRADVRNLMGPYLVKVTDTSLNIRSGPGISYSVTGIIKNKGVYTIVDTRNGWGKLKSGAGWINLKYTRTL